MFLQPRTEISLTKEAVGDGARHPVVTRTAHTTGPAPVVGGPHGVEVVGHLVQGLDKYW